MEDTSTSDYLKITDAEWERDHSGCETDREVRDLPDGGHETYYFCPLHRVRAKWDLRPA